MNVPIELAALQQAQGAAKPVHILTPAATVRRVVNMTAWIVVDAGVPR